MPIVCLCPQCHTRSQAPDHLAGESVKCRCGGVVQVPGPSAPQSATGAQGKPSVRCESCGKVHRPPASMAGKSARCSCGSTVKIPAAAPPAVADMSPAQSDKLETYCSQCGKRHRVGQHMAGKRAKCACGNVVQIPSPVMAGQTAGHLPANNVSDLLDEWDNHEVNLKPPEDDGVPKKAKRSEDEILASYMRPDDTSFSSSGVNSGPMLRGSLMMIGAAVWFVGGLFAGYIFFYPPILFVLGMIEFGRGVASS